MTRSRTTCNERRQQACTRYFFLFTFSVINLFYSPALPWGSFFVNCIYKNIMSCEMEIFRLIFIFESCACCFNRAIYPSAAFRTSLG